MSPYEQIAGALRDRITSGELRPGDPLPSTRALAREWKVALATAAHALRSLAAEGLVVGVPRVGTVVAEAQARPRPRAREGELGRERIVATGIALADREGIGALTLRGLAAKLDVPVMSLYRHVGSKEELLGLMTDAALGEERLPAEPPPGWRAQLELSARVQWRGMKRHPWLARVMSVTRPSPLPNALDHAEWMLRALEGLSPAERLRLHVILYGFVQGIAVNLEAEAEAVSETGLTEQEWMQTQQAAFAALARSGRYPVFAAVLGELHEDFDLDLDALFETGLAALLDGFGARMTR